jgi:dGTPase
LLENNGHGLNLTHEVKVGIYQHSKGTSSILDLLSDNANGASRASTLEGEVVQFADWFAYINHDVDDAFNMGLITKDDLPSNINKILGINFEQRLVTMLKDVIETSAGKEHIQMSEQIMLATDELRQFLYDYVYKLLQVAKRENMARTIMTFLYKYYLDNYDLVIKEFPYLKDEEHQRVTCDFIASLTDKKAQELYYNQTSK